MQFEMQRSMMRTSTTPSYTHDDDPLGMDADDELDMLIHLTQHHVTHSTDASSTSRKVGARGQQQQHQREPDVYVRTSTV